MTIDAADMKHGAVGGAGYMWHYRRGTTQSCKPCRDAWAEYYQQKRELHRRMDILEDTERRHPEYFVSDADKEDFKSKLGTDW